MPPKKDKDSSAVLHARDYLMKLSELIQKPGVRADPVVRALLKGIAPTPSAFENASLAVAAIRNAGCLNATNNSTADISAPNPTKGEKKEKPKKAEKEKLPTTKKLRGFDRSLDVILEDAVVRGNYPDKESHPAAKKLRELRADPMRIVKVKKLQAEFEEKTWPNGKKSKLFKHLKKGADGTYIQDGQDEDTYVKDIRDFDLLALEAEPVLWSLIEETQTELFSVVDFAGNPEGLKEAYPSLKGTEVLNMMLAGETAAATLRSALAEANFARFGPSKTLWFPEKTKYVSRNEAKPSEAKPDPEA
jgi:hypothetical protein